MSLAATSGLGLGGRVGLGVTPTQVAQFQPEHRYQILPAYAQDGVILVRLFQGSTDSTLFEDFIEQLLPISPLINLSVSTPKLAL